MTVKACKFIVLCTKRLFEDCIIIRETSGHVILVFLNMTGVSLLVVCSFQLAHSKSWPLETFGVCSGNEPALKCGLGIYDILTYHQL